MDSYHLRRSKSTFNAYYCKTFNMRSCSMPGIIQEQNEGLAPSSFEKSSYSLLRSWADGKKHMKKSSTNCLTSPSHPYFSHPPFGCHVSIAWKIGCFDKSRPKLREISPKGSKLLALASATTSTTCWRKLDGVPPSI